MKVPVASGGEARRRRWSLTAVVLLAAALAACTSGPPPIDDQPYVREIEGFRAAKDAMFGDPRSINSPIASAERARFTGLAYYPVDPAARIPASLTEDRSGPPLVIQLETSKGQRDSFHKVGALGFSFGGETYRLTAFAGVDDPAMNRLFLPFNDLTNGTETYGGGRYVELDRTPTGLYDLDFNRAYHPYCVYNYEFECPVPPLENRLPIAIRAGERLPPGYGSGK